MSMPRSGGAHFVGTRWTSATRLPISDSFITPSEDEPTPDRPGLRLRQACGSRAGVVQQACETGQSANPN